MTSRMLMVHPGLPEGPTNPRPVSREAFDKVWKAKGWKPATAKKPAANKKEKSQ